MKIYKNAQRMGLFCIIALSCLLITPAWSIQSTMKSWSSFTLTGNYGAFVYNVEPQLRLIERNSSPFRFNQYLTNAGGGYQWSPAWTFWFGQTWGTTSQDAEPGSLEEYRLWEQITWSHKIASVDIISRMRLEQRKSCDFPEWAQRMRERVFMEIPLVSNMSLAVSDEILINLNRVQWITTQTWDQNRAYLGVVQKLSKEWFLSVGYMNQYIFTARPQADNVLVLNLRVNLAD